MTTRQRVQVAVFVPVVVLATWLAGPSAAPQAPASAQTAALTAQIPVDPQITMGKLPNGLRYYVRANKQPQNRAELRLAVNAGSILEDDDQRGLAHMCEHMAFNGTKHFPKQDVVTFMQSIGMRFGAHVNAYTSFDETVYMLTIPTDKPEVMDKALTILEDWAHDVTFDPVEIDKERGVVMEEWRLGRGAGARIQDKQFPILLQGSRYADRLPIGKPEILQNFKPDRLTKFYKDWYRPDLMAVVAVGDFDKAAVEGLIRTHFAPIPAPSSPRPRTFYDVPDHPGTLFAIATDKEMPSTSVNAYRLMPLRDPTTVGAYRQQIVETLFSSMLSARFVEIAQKPNAPFLGAGGGRGLFVRTKEAVSLGAGVREDGVEKGLDALFTEADRVVKFGFTQTELDRQKASLLRSLDRAATEKDKQESGSLAAEYIRNFLQREPIPGIVYENDLHKRYVPEITLSETNVLAKDWFPDNNRVVVVGGPDKPGLTMPDATRLAAVIKAVPGKDTTPYVDSVAAATLLDALPAPGTVAKTSTNAAFEITEWTLSNGVKVALKPTTNKADEILFRAFSPGGHSLASDADYVPASSATSVVTTGGIGKLSLPDLRKFMTGKVASSSPFIGELDQGLSGSASRRDLETMFQLIYLDFTQPRPDPTMFGVMQSQLRTILTNQAATPDFAFSAAISDALYNKHPRRQPQTVATIDQMDLEKSVAFYKERFADASGFTFVFIGSFDLPTLRPLVERYLGSLPSTHRQETWKDVGARYATGVVERRVEKGIDPKSQVNLTFTGPFQYDQNHRIAIRAMADVLQTRLLEVIREQLGGTYSISVSAGYSRIPRQEYSVAINFGCDPTRTDDLIKRVFQEIDQFKAAGPSDKQLADVRAALLRDLEGNMKQNSYLLNQIYLKYLYGEDPAGLLLLADYYNKLDAATIQEAAKTYFNMNNYVKVTLFPEKKLAPAPARQPALLTVR